MRALFFALVVALGACGDSGGDDGSCGEDITGVAPCEAAARYLVCGPCDTDPDVDVSAYSLDPNTCEADGDLLCANCINTTSFRETCVLTADSCAAQCDSARN